MLFSGFLTGDKADLILPPPGLTRYKKEVAIKASKKKGGDPRDPDERRSSEINMLTTATLCIRLNTLHVSVLQFPSHCLVGWFFQHPCHTHIYSIMPPFIPWAKRQGSVFILLSCAVHFKPCGLTWRQHPRSVGCEKTTGWSQPGKQVPSK